MPGLLEDAVSAAVLAETADWFAAMPGTVVSVNEDGTVNVQPLVNRKYLDTYTRRPIVPNVPLLLPALGLGAIELEASEGDTVLLVCASRSTDEVRESGNQVSSPQDARRFSLSDSYAVPLATALPPVTTLRLVNGKVRLGSELVDVISTLRTAFQALATNLVPTLPVPESEAVITAMGAAATALLTLEE